MFRPTGDLLKLISTLTLTFLISSITPAQADDFEAWADQQYKVSLNKLMNNINRPDTRPGTVVASPSKHDPNYYYNWIRDAALVMKTINRVRTSGLEPKLEEKFLGYLYDFAAISRFHQETDTLVGLGEVKFHVDGTTFKGPWGRPQNDGPAIRASVLTQFAHYLLDQGKSEYVRTQLYDALLPSNSVIKRDLEYVSHNWTNYDFCLWEEVMANHFFTRLVQRRALLDGASLARRLGDHGAAQWYEWQAGRISSELETHWDGRWKLFRAHHNRVGGVDYKAGMDSSVILAAIYSQAPNDGEWTVRDERFMASLETMRKKFKSIYRINQYRSDLAPAIGRYPEDRYTGHHTGGLGNPWFLNTAGFANYLYRLAAELKKIGTMAVNSTNQRFYAHILGDSYVEMGQFTKDEMEFDQLVQALIEEGDSYLKRMRLHMASDGSMAEQINRETGHMQGARDLTWSYAAYISAYLSRVEATR